MKKTSKLISFAAAAALLLSGCNAGTPAPAVSESETTTSAAETTTATTTTEETASSATTTAEVSVIADEDDKKPSVDEKPTDIMQYTLNQLLGKRINCENQSSLNMNVTDEWTIEPGDVPVKDSWTDEITFSFKPENYRYNPCARWSSGAMSAECDNAFRAAVAGTQDAIINEWRNDMFTAETTVMTVDHADGAVYMSKIEYGFDTKCYDQMFTLNAFIRRAKEIHNDRIIPEPEYYEFIIDPAYMRYLSLPMTEYDPEKMKFSVNGKEFYADTMRGYAAPLTYLDDGVSVSKFQNDDFIYAKIVLKKPSFKYNNIDGAFVSADIMLLEPITDDTDSVISGSFKTDAYAPDVYAAVLAAKDEIITDTTIAVDLIDLDFDGTPEVVTQYCDDVTEMDGPYSPDRHKVFAYISGKMQYLGDFVTCDNNPLKEVIYIATGEHGWHYTDYKDHCFMTVKNGKLDIRRLTEHKPVGEMNEYGYYDNFDYYYLGEKIVIEPYDDFNPLIGNTKTYYKWTSSNSLGYSVMSESTYKVYDMLYENLGNEFKTLRKYDISPKIDCWTNDVWETGKLTVVYTPSASFPEDALDVYYTNKQSEVYEAYYNISFEGAKEKPVIYLYPEEETDVSVQVNFPLGGELTCTYPDYGDGWNVTAMPDGTLYDKNGDEYYCLYWEGKGAADFDMSKGFCVAGADTAKFLREKLMYIGLTAREANEFIIYWLPKMQDNPYNIITLHTDDYARSVPLTVSPAPDTQIRVFMTYYSSDTPVDIPEQELPHYGRNGFTLVEWGGSEE